LGNPEIQVKPDRERTAELQLSNQELGFMVNALVDGAKVSNYKFEGEEIDLTLRGKDIYANRIQDLEQLPIYTPGGKLVTLGSVADIRLITGPEQVNHIERVRAITLQVIPPEQIPLEKAMEMIQKEIVAPMFESGQIGGLNRVRLAGTVDDLTKTFHAFKWNFLLALLITYLLMASLFESFLYPFVIMFSVPLSIVGGFLGLHAVNIFTYQPMDVLTMLGFVILIGIVVNNAILLVHQSLNNIRDHQLPLREAVRESVRSRVRPIFMSVLTTLFGLSPLVIFSGSGSELYRGIGSVVLGGLLVSTIFTLFVVPALFSLLLEGKEKLLNPVTIIGGEPKEDMEVSSGRLSTFWKRLNGVK
jgi:HAE1 family hydrophobic/amphiphilic exporter-1